jgi:hypothetical protein
VTLSDTFCTEGIVATVVYISVFLSGAALGRCPATGSIPSDWAGAIGDHASVLLALNGFRAEQDRSGAVIYQPAGMELEALRLTSLRNVRAVILGQVLAFPNGSGRYRAGRTIGAAVLQV